MTKKTLNNTDINGASKNVPDIEVFGNGDMWKLLSKASSKKEGWMKSTKALEILGKGVIVQVTTQQKNLDGTYSLAEAITFVPGAEIKTNFDKEKRVIGRDLVKADD